MSVVAEFARKLHESDSSEDNDKLNPLQYPAVSEKLYEVRALIVDIYGTLMNYWRDDFSEEEAGKNRILKAFEMTCDFFGMNESLADMNPAMKAPETLRDFYHGLISLHHERMKEKKVSFPEVKVEIIWQNIITILERHGYKPDIKDCGSGKDFARCAAYYYNYRLFNRGFYPGVVPALEKLKESNIKLGIISNAQFYTPIDLTLFIRDQSGGRLDDMYDLFERDMCFFSYEYGASKPNPVMVRELYSSLYEYHILPSQTVFAGNDLETDIKMAQNAGMKTAFFTGDRRCAFLHGEEGKIIPDITLESWEELPGKLSFFKEKT